VSKTSTTAVVASIVSGRTVDILVVVHLRVTLLFGRGSSAQQVARPSAAACGHLGLRLELTGSGPSITRKLLRAEAAAQSHGCRHTKGM